MLTRIRHNQAASGGYCHTARRRDAGDAPMLPTTAEARAGRGGLSARGRSGQYVGRAWLAGAATFAPRPAPPPAEGHSADGATRRVPRHGLCAPGSDGENAQNIALTYCARTRKRTSGPAPPRPAPKCKRVHLMWPRTNAGPSGARYSVGCGSVRACEPV